MKKKNTPSGQNFKQYTSLTLYLEKNFSTNTKSRAMVSGFTRWLRTRNKCKDWRQRGIGENKCEWTAQRVRILMAIVNAHQKTHTMQVSLMSVSFITLLKNVTLHFRTINTNVSYINSWKKIQHCIERNTCSIKFRY